MAKIYPGLLFDWGRALTPDTPKGRPGTLSEALRLQRGLEDEAVAEGASVRDDPFFPEIARAAQWLSQRAKPGGRVFINADYDVDGVTSACILSRACEALHMRTDVFVPSRFSDSYGVNLARIRASHAAERLSLVICVDCGASSLKELSEFAQSSGRPILVLDHHTPDQGQSGVLDVNPHRHPNLIPSQYCAGLMSHLLVEALCDSTPELKAFTRESQILAGLAVIGDVVSVRGVASRLAAAYCVQKANEPNGSVGLRAILGSRCGGKPWLGTDDFGYRVCPLINVAGRIDSAQRAINLFQCRDPQRALGLVKELEELNRKRQTLQSGVEAEARSRHQEGSRLLVAYDRNWHHGVVGPAAGRLSEEFNIPVILGGYASDLKSYAFSGRSRGGVHLYETLKKALSGVEVNFGGHKAAIGMKIPEDQVAKIAETLRERSDLIIPDPARLSREYAAQLRPSSIQIAHWKEVNSLEPYGPDNETPTFMVRDAELELRRSSYRPHDAYGIGKGKDEKNAPHQFPVIVHDSPQLSSIASFRGHLFGRLFLKDGRRGASVCFQLEDVVPANGNGAML
jgi:single-stranded-DNA-specific exonuclease